MEYNGWSNYETWLVNLWMDNEPGGKEFIWDWLGEQSVAVQAGNLAYYLEITHEDEVENINVTGFWKDLLNGALSEINWMEVAIHIMEEWEERNVEQSKRDHHISVSLKKLMEGPEEKEND